jgi:methyltransferase (TIGR00027 family)
VDAVGRTAIAVAAVRAAETERPDRLFDDPFAAAFVAADAAGTAGATRPVEIDSADPRQRTLLRGIVVRTRFFDEMLVHAARDCPQVVLLGAGLDTRAQRLTWPVGTTVFEVDVPEMLEWKQETLDRLAIDPACRRVVVPVDLRDDWPAALMAAAHDTGVPTAWLAEGLLVYLEPSEVEYLLSRITSLSLLGSRLGLTVRMSRTPARSDLWRSHAPRDPVAWLAGHGWDATLHPRGRLAVDYGRPEWSDLGDQSLIDATRRLDS